MGDDADGDQGGGGERVRVLGDLVASSEEIFCLKQCLKCRDISDVSDDTIFAMDNPPTEKSKTNPIYRCKPKYPPILRDEQKKIGGKIKDSAFFSRSFLTDDNKKWIVLREISVSVSKD